MGKATGKEVVQLYVAAPNSQQNNKPAQELKAFAKTKTLQPGEEQTLELRVKTADLASFSTQKQAWLVDGGTYRFLIGASSRDIRATLSADVAAQQTKVNNLLAPKEPLNLLHR